jgi:hypothetical protein
MRPLASLHGIARTGGRLPAAGAVVDSRLVKFWTPCEMRSGRRRKELKAQLFSGRSIA